MMRSRTLPALALFVACTVLNGCTHSHMIQVSVTNTSNQKLSDIEIKYPEATFGINVLEPGKTFQYRILPTDSGSLSIKFLNARAVDHAATGPTVHKGDEGSIEIKLTQDEVTSNLKLK